MASFTDQITQFNPYVQQLPIDAMVKVGMYKQQKYDEGVQKIQGYIDNIAGLDVMHESDKAYLQAKLNQLGDKLKGVAAGDFSNQQLVTSVGGMATQISKDANVQNAVSSTAWHRRQIETIEAARKEGKTAASNIANYDKQVKKYLDNKEAGQVFRGQYSPYRDVNKKIFEAIKLVHPSAQSIDQAYGLTKDGKIDMDNVLAALKRQGIETVSEGKLRTAIGAALDSEDYHQLYIDGEYQLSSAAPEKLKEYAMNDYSKSREYAKGQIQKIKEQLLTTSTIAGQLQLNKDLEYFEDELGNPAKGIRGRLDKNYESTIQSINDDPDVARGKIYSKNYIDQFANGYAWANVKDELLDSPVRDDYWKLQNYKLAQIKEGHDWELGKAQVKIGQRNATVNELEAEIKLREFNEKNGPNKPYFTGAGDETTDNNTSYENYLKYNNNLKQANEDVLTTMSDLLSDVNTRVPKSQLEKNIKDYQNGKYKPGTADEARLMDRYIENNNLLKNNQALHTKIRDQEYVKATGFTEDDYKKRTIGNRNPITLTDKDGRKVTYSPNEVYDFLSKEEVTTDVAGDTPVSTIKITKSLSPKEKLLQEKLKNRYLGLPGGDKTLNAYIADFDQAFAKSKATDRKVYQEVVTRLAPYTGIFRTEQAGIKFPEGGKSKTQFVTDLSNFIKSDINLKTAGPNYKPLKAIEKLVGKDLADVEFLFTRAGDDYSINIVDKNDPTNNQILKVPEDWVRTNDVLKNGYLNSNTEFANTLLRGAGSTSAFKGGEDAYKYAHYQGGKIGRTDINGNKTVTLPVAANLTKGSDGKLYPTFYLKTADGPINIKLFDPTTKSQFENQYLPGLTNDDIRNLFRSKYSNIDQLIPQ